MDRSTRLTSLSCVNNGEVIPTSRVSVSSDAAMVGTLLRLMTCERGLFGHSAKPATAAGIDAGDPRLRLHPVRESRTTFREVATRHETEE